MRLEPKLSGGSIEIDLNGIQEGTHPLVLDGGGASFVVDPEAGFELRDYRFEGSVTVGERDCQVRGSLSGVLETACDRCLAAFGRPIEAELDASVAVGTVSPEEREPKDQGSRRDGAVADLTDSLREAVLLEIPIKNVCKSDSRGICPQCGVNRNIKSCDCRPNLSDPRWEALKRISFSSDAKE